jgi:hypothetical protein
MIDFETAKQIAIEHIGADCALVEEATFEKPYGCIFMNKQKLFSKPTNSGMRWLGLGVF